MIEPARLVLGPLIADHDPGWAERAGAIGYPDAKVLSVADLTPDMPESPAATRDG